jgi:hypothetical protein
VLLPSAAYVPARVALLRDFLVEHLSKELTVVEAECEKKRPRKPAARGR